jgi:hypothetical protein
MPGPDAMETTENVPALCWTLSVVSGGLYVLYTPRKFRKEVLLPSTGKM